MQQPWPRTSIPIPTTISRESYVLEQCIFVRLQNPSARHPTSWSLKEMFHIFTVVWNNIKVQHCCQIIDYIFYKVLNPQQGDATSRKMESCDEVTVLLTQSLKAPHPLEYTFKQFMRALLFSRSISKRRVVCQVCPSMCLKYRKSSPRCAINLSLGIWANSWLYFSGTLG